MNEMTGAVVSTSLVLMAVFIPVAFFPGTTGKLYQQFALIIAFAIVVSTFNALSFSPSMSAILLRPQQEARGVFGWLFGRFNQFLAWLRDRYQSMVGFLIRIRYLVMAAFVAALFATYYRYLNIFGVKTVSNVYIASLLLQIGVFLDILGFQRFFWA